MEDAGGGDDEDGESADVEGRGSHAQGEDGVLPEHDAVRGAEAEEDDVRHEHAGGKHAGTAEDALEVDAFTTGAREGGAEVEVDCESAEGDEASDDPHRDGHADGAKVVIDGGGD